MNSETKQAVVVTTVVLGAIYLFLFLPSYGGYGYQGYSGSSSRSSLWYWNSVETFHERSNRSGSVGGLGVMGGGPESGK